MDTKNTTNTINTKNIEIAPSILSADFYNLGKDIEEIKKHIKYLHIDVMDGHFVPNLSIGVPIIKSLKNRFSELIFDVHLMITNPEKYISVFAEAGSDIITFHREVNINPTLIINQIQKCGTKAGISLNPDTDIKTLDCVLEKIDLVLIMSVFPGFGGQKFIEAILPKIKYLDDYRKKNNSDFMIEIDGGINKKTAPLVIENGADILVAGSYVFNAADKVDAINSLY